MVHVQYAYAGKQFIRYMLADSESADAIVLYGGWPAEISGSSVMEAFRDAGYHVFNPVYPGLYQSHGTFIESDIIDEQAAFFETLQEGSIYNLFLDDELEFTVENIHIIGSSFGGSIALATANAYTVDSLMLFAPVWDWREQEDLDEEVAFAQRAFKHVYRLADDIQDVLVNTKELQPEHYSQNLPEKILVFHDPEDEVVAFSQSSDAQGIISFELREHDFGHGMSDVVAEYWNEIISFLSTRP